MRMMMLFDQIQSGLGTKDDGNLPLGLDNKLIGPAVMMKPYLLKENIKITHCIYCGTSFFFEHEEAILKKLATVLVKANPDIIVCGPSFNYKPYSEMCVHVASYLKKNTDLKVLCAMAKENQDLIVEYKDMIPILKMPKKGESGLSEALENICRMSKDIVDGKQLKSELFYE